MDEHNRGIAPQGIQHQNFLNYSEKEPTLGDPTTFFYVEILTLTPSVNMSVTSRLHPELIWLVTESHNSTVTEGYDNGYCDKRIVRRHFDEMKPKNVVAFYTLDGLIEKVGNETLYNTANRTVVLADNETPVVGHSEVPFKPSFLCTMMAFFSKYILGDMIDLNCYEESLARASPYATGVYNFTVRNRTIVAPHLSVALQGEFTMDYTEDGLEEHMEDGECETDTWDGNGTITLAASDFASYEVQNDYMTIIPYLPGAFSLSGNTSEDVLYHASLLSTSSLYKYYSKMDGKTAGAYYIHSFNVTEDGYGTQFILANLTNHAGLLPEDPESQNNYTGAHRILYLIQASGLRSPTEMNNLSYNYSRIYDIEEVFYNVSNGEHEALLEFYTWFGDYSAPSDIHVSSGTVLALQASAIGDTVVVACTLMSRNKPVAGQPVELRVDGQTLVAMTNALGVCTATFDTGGAQGVVGEFKGTPELLPSSATYALFTSKPMAIAADFSIGNFGLLLLLAGLFAFSFLSLARSFNPMGGGAFMGDVFGKFFPFAKRPGQGKKMIRVKKGKELAISMAAAVATGGAGGAVAGKTAAKKAAAEAAKKKAAEAARKAKELRVRRELSEKGAVGSIKKREKKGEEKSRTGRAFGGIGEPGRDKRKNDAWLQNEVWNKCADPRQTLSKKDLKELNGMSQRIGKQSANWLSENIPPTLGRHASVEPPSFVAGNSHDFAVTFYAKYTDSSGGSVKTSLIHNMEKSYLKGATDPHYRTVGINMEVIRDAHDFHKAEMQSCFTLTRVHEGLHLEGDFQSNFNGKDLQWAYEGITEKLSRQMMADEFPALVKHVKCDSYDALVKVVDGFEDLVGREKLMEGYFKKDFQIVYDRLLELKLTPAEANQLLDVLGRCDGNIIIGDPEYIQAINTLNEAKAKVIRRK
ncbi:MAG: Ig-like domain-containing protein [Candidatus ainarchaeum sp.]|nr:Ig-like domain-containing protein [Candidatus ainarchaeum sp.]